MYREVISFATSDGKLFECENAARKHSRDLLGQELDALIRLAIPDITRAENYRAAMNLLEESNRGELIKLVNSIIEILLFAE